MTKREMNLRVFQKKEVPHPFFQPRIEPWYAWHKQFGKLPPRYRDLSLLEFYDGLDISMRYVHYYTEMPNPVAIEYSEKVKTKRVFTQEEGRKIIQTPYGELISRFKKTIDKTWRTVEFPVRDADDLKKLRWLFENTSYHFSMENFEKGSEFIGERGEPQFWVPKSPYMALAQQWMTLDDMIYALADAPEEIEGIMKAMDESYIPLYEEIISYGKVKIINFGENLDIHYFSPSYFEKYHIPFYEKRSGQLRKAGIFTHIHIDGSFKPLLKYLRNLPFDGYEALTPLPQGDMEVEEIKEHIGDKILLDGIPAILFLPTYSEEEFRKFVERIIRMFHPQLILGISDEIPEGCEEEGIERVRWVCEYCKAFRH